MSTKTDREPSKSVFYLKVLYLFIRKRGFTVVALSMAKEGFPAGYNAPACDCAPFRHHRGRTVIRGADRQKGAVRRILCAL